MHPMVCRPLLKVNQSLEFNNCQSFAEIAHKSLQSILLKGMVISGAGRSASPSSRVKMIFNKSYNDKLLTIDRLCDEMFAKQLEAV